MILHDFALSSASYRVRIALNLKGLDYETRSYRLRAGDQRGTDYIAINPAGLVPTVEIDGRIITQSLAIIDYLDATRVEPRLIPVDPAERSRVLAIALTIACDVHPLNNLRVLQYLETVMGQDGTARDAWYRTWISSGFAAIEAALHNHISRQELVHCLIGSPDGFQGGRAARIGGREKGANDGTV